MFCFCFLLIAVRMIRVYLVAVACILQMWSIQLRSDHCLVSIREYVCNLWDVRLRGLGNMYLDPGSLEFLLSNHLKLSC